MLIICKILPAAVFHYVCHIVVPVLTAVPCHVPLRWTATRQLWIFWRDRCNLRIHHPCWSTTSLTYSTIVSSRQVASTPVWMTALVIYCCFGHLSDWNLQFSVSHCLNGDTMAVDWLIQWGGKLALRNSELSESDVVYTIGAVMSWGQNLQTNLINFSVFLRVFL